MDKKSVLVVDDHPLFRDGLKGLVERSAGYYVAGEAGSGAEAQALVRKLTPHLVTMDVSLPDMSGIDAVREIVRLAPGVRVLMLSMYPKFEYVAEAFRAGARGYVVKEATSARLIQAMDTLMQGEYYLDGMLSQDIVVKLMTGSGQENAIQDEKYGLLTPREQQVMRLVVDGMASKEIAAKLDLSLKTVDNHRANLMKKLEVHNRMELVKYAARLGLVDVDTWK